MNFRHVSILIVLASLALFWALAMGWDLYLAAVGKLEYSWCQAVRDLNKWSDGLLLWGGGLFTIGVCIHIFCVQWFPPEWRHF